MHNNTEKSNGASLARVGIRYLRADSPLADRRARLLVHRLLLVVFRRARRAGSGGRLHS